LIFDIRGRHSSKKKAIALKRLMTIPLIDTGMVEMKFLQAGALPDLMSLQNVIAANLPCPEIFMLHDDMYLGRDINLPEEELTKVAHLQAAVHPAYRGNGLQRKLTSAHLRSDFIVLPLSPDLPDRSLSPRPPHLLDF